MTSEHDLFDAYRVDAGRDEWRKRAEKAEARVAELEAAIHAFVVAPAGRGCWSVEELAAVQRLRALDAGCAAPSVSKDGYCERCHTSLASTYHEHHCPSDASPGHDGSRAPCIDCFHIREQRPGHPLAIDPADEAIVDSLLASKAREARPMAQRSDYPRNDDEESPTCDVCGQGEDESVGRQVNVCQHCYSVAKEAVAEVVPAEEIRALRRLAVAARIAHRDWVSDKVPTINVQMAALGEAIVDLNRACSETARRPVCTCRGSQYEGNCPKHGDEPPETGSTE